MMTKVVALATLAFVAPIGAGSWPSARLSAQVAMQTTPPPAATADSELWYTSGAPIRFNGVVYHPSGPVTHFDRNEMVPTGTFERTTIYVKPTVETGSVVYVPLAGGVMRPYERRRSGDLAGTVGSSAPSFPVILPSAENMAVGPERSDVQVPAEPTPGGAAGIPAYAREELDTVPLATAGGTPECLPLAEAPLVRPSPPRLASAVPPIGLNGVFVTFDNSRWFASGEAVALVPGRFTRVGEHHGFPVYTETGRGDAIYLPLLSTTPDRLTPYTRR